MFLLFRHFFKSVFLFLGTSIKTVSSRTSWIVLKLIVIYNIIGWTPSTAMLKLRISVTKCRLRNKEYANTQFYYHLCRFLYSRCLCCFMLGITYFIWLRDDNIYPDVSVKMARTIAWKPSSVSLAEPSVDNRNYYQSKNVSTCIYIYHPVTGIFIDITGTYHSSHIFSYNWDCHYCYLITEPIPVRLRTTNKNILKVINWVKQQRERHQELNLTSSCTIKEMQHQNVDILNRINTQICKLTCIYFTVE